MTILCALVLVLVQSIMCLPNHDDNDYFHDIRCNYDQPFRSRSIIPAIEQNVYAKGCLSSDLGAGTKEVHLLSLQNSGSARSGAGNLPGVSLSIRPRWKQKDSSPVMVIILHSLSPVRWQISLPPTRNSTSFHIIVNKQSHVVPSISAHFSTRNLPPLKGLPSWARSRHGAITSFSSMSLANEITLYVGSDFDAPAVCNVSSQEPSPNVRASFVQVQHATGCLVHSPQSETNQIFVIELSSFIRNRDTVIILEKDPSREKNGDAEHQNIILVLKCHSQGEWVIKSSGIKGSVTILAEYPVHIQANPSSITSRVQDTILPNDSAALLHYVQNYFGSVYTYLKTERANRATIFIKDKVQSPTDFTLSSAESVDKLNSTYTMTSNIKPPMTASKSESLTGQPLSSHLLSHVIVDCSADQMSIAFPFESTMDILTSTLGPFSKLSKVTLANTGCVAKSNQTFILLITSFNECGTKAESEAGKITFYNQVQFITEKFKPYKESSDHHLTDDDDYISEDGSGFHDAKLDSQKPLKEERIIYPLPVICSKPVADNSPPSVQQEFKSESFDLKIYTKKDFSSSSLRKSYPLNVVVHDHLFAEALIRADPRLCINIDECWLTENNGYTNEKKKSTLIKQGCPTDLSAKILSKSHCGSHDDDHYRMRFSFQLSEDFIDQNLYLHCRLTSCAMKDGDLLNIKQCVENENICTKPNLRPYLEPLRGKKYSMLIQGPFHIVPKAGMDKDKDLFTFTKPEVTNTPDNFVVDYSFDKLTGNNKKTPVSQQLIFIGLSTEAVVGIAFASFVIGAGLMATLWLIHMHTEPNRQVRGRRKSSVKQYQNESQ